MSDFQIEQLRALLPARRTKMIAAGASLHALQMQQHEDDCRILALTMVGEGRGESLDGRVAIGWTVRNRSTEKGQTIAARCLQRLQYSTWWPQGGVENYRVTLDLAEAVFVTGLTITTPRFAVYHECAVLAGGVIDGRLRDRTHGSTHYLTTQLLAAHPPAWVDRPATVVLGSHAFFAGIAWS